MDRLLGVETEYALGAGDARGASGRASPVLEALLRSARSQLATLPDQLSHGVFLQNGARFYVDCGGHPEFTTPECSNPWDVVRYIRAGEAILLRLAGTLGRRRPAFFRCNVDYSGTGSTWGCHESYMHRADPALLPKQTIPHLVSRLVYAGAGGFDNLSPGVRFTLSPRTVHLTRDVSHDSTNHRGIFHTKDEPLCGNGYHRLHILCGESLCSERATWLKVGTTALVVALSEAGLCPGDAVELRAPVEAMRLFASDPTCTAAAETKTGERVTALAIQRHYLAQAEAHVHEPFMPPWADEVCRRWRAVLDCLSAGWASAATSLDWAIKLALYKEEACRRGCGWEVVATWTTVASELTAALARAGQSNRPLTAQLVLDRHSLIAADVARLASTVLREHGLGWDGFAAFLDLRNRLFEIDTRFGQLGSEGIFSALDADGLLTHHVDGVDNIEHAVDNPPAVARARLRGQLVRELTGNGDRYCCDWEGVWDSKEEKQIDLSDPFVAAREWKDWSEEDADAMSPEQLSRRMAALQAYQTGDYTGAERLLRSLLVDRFEVPSTHCHLARVLLMQDRSQEAATEARAAWEHRAEAPFCIVLRTLWLRLALRYTWPTEVVETDSAPVILGQLKPALEREDAHSEWAMNPVLAHLERRLPADQHALLAALVAALNDASSVPALDRFPAWRDAPAEPLE